MIELGPGQKEGTGWVIGGQPRGGVAGPIRLYPNSLSRGNKQQAAITVSL